MRGWNETRWHASVNETGGEGRGSRDKYFLPVCFALLLRRRYISSRRKKFNVAVKADGNADCGLWASPVTVLHRTMHISQSGPSSFSPPSARRPPRSLRRMPPNRLALPDRPRKPGILGFPRHGYRCVWDLWSLYHLYMRLSLVSPKTSPKLEETLSILRDSRSRNE